MKAIINFVCFLQLVINCSLACDHWELASRNGSLDEYFDGNSWGDLFFDESDSTTQPTQAQPAAEQGVIDDFDEIDFTSFRPFLTEDKCGRTVLHTSLMNGDCATFRKKIKEMPGDCFFREIMTKITLFKYSLFLVFLNQIEATSRLSREIFLRESEKKPFKEWSLRNPTGKSLNERLQENRDYYILGEGSDEIDVDLRMPFTDKTSIDEPVELTEALIEKFISVFERPEKNPIKCLACTVLAIQIEPVLLSKYADRLRVVFLNLKNIQTVMRR